MKKKIMFMAIMILSLIAFSGNVYADELIKCVYDWPENYFSSGLNIKVTCTADEESLSCTTGNPNFSVNKDTLALTPVNFQSNKKWKCPSNLYYDKGTYGGGINARPILKNLNNNSGEVTLTLNSSESSDGGAISADNAIGDASSHSCKYGSLVVVYSADGELSVTNSTCSVVHSFKQSDFANGCPTKVWGSKTKYNCRYTIEKELSGAWVSLNADDPVLDADNNEIPSEETPTSDGKDSNDSVTGDNDNDSIQYVGDNFCSTAEVLSVLRMFGFVIFILRLSVPIIIIVVETLKFYNAIKDGSSDSFSKHIKSLLIRVGIGLVIFFAPTIFHAILDVFIDPDSKNCEICVLKPFSCDPGNPSSMKDVNSSGNANSNPYANPAANKTDKECVKQCESYKSISPSMYDACLTSCK